MYLFGCFLFLAFYVFLHLTVEKDLREILAQIGEEPLMHVDDLKLSDLFEGWQVALVVVVFSVLWLPFVVVWAIGTLGAYKDVAGSKGVSFLTFASSLFLMLIYGGVGVLEELLE